MSRGDGPSAEAPPPSGRAYAGLILAAWAFWALQSWLFAAMLGSWRGIGALGIFLAAGFTAVALFDFFWTRSNAAPTAVSKGSVEPEGSEGRGEFSNRDFPPASGSAGEPSSPAPGTSPASGD